MRLENLPYDACMMNSGSGWVQIGCIVALGTAFLLGCSAERGAEETAQGDVEFIRTSGDPPGLPFSGAVRVGNLLFLSGQIGVLPGSLTLVEGGVTAETRQTLENIKTVLDAAGSSFDRVVKCTVFLADIEDYQVVNAVYATYFGDRPPARSAVAGSGLALGAAVEIECIAVVAT